MDRWIYDDEHEAFRETLTSWVEREILPWYGDWERDGIVPRAVFKDAGAQGFLGPDVPEEYGGGGAPDWRFNAVLNEVFGMAGIPGVGIPLHNDVILPYLLRHANDEQRQRWLPGMVAGELIGAIAMTEPGTGSDLAGISTTARPDGDDYVLTGSKTFISNGILADVVIVVAKTDPAAGHRGISLLVVERGMMGFERGRNLDKLGMHAQDTAELHFADVRVPRENLLGEEGKGFYHLMEGLAQERLVVSVGGLANAVGVLEQTKTYVRERTAFGQPIGTFQVNRHKLADMYSRIQQAQVFLDRSVELHCRGELDAVEAAMAKYLVSDLQFEVIDECLQLHGGYGFMEEYPVARAFRDCRAQRIYAGTNEVMKDLVGRSLGF